MFCEPLQLRPPPPLMCPQLGAGPFQFLPLVSTANSLPHPVGTCPANAWASAPASQASSSLSSPRSESLPTFCPCSGCMDCICGLCGLTEKALAPRSEVRTRAVHHAVAPTSVHQPVSSGYATPSISQAEGYVMPPIAQLFRTSLMNDVSKEIDRRFASPSRGPSHRVLVEREQEIRDAFVTMDVTNAGMLEYSEIKAAIRALGFPVKKKEVLAAMEKHGAMAHDRIDFDTFHTIMSEKYVELDPMQMMLKAFQLFDKQAQGRISVRDLQVVAAKLGEHLSDNELQAMIDQFDKNRDGEIDELEFIQIMQMTGLY